MGLQHPGVHCNMVSILSVSTAKTWNLKHQPENECVSWIRMTPNQYKKKQVSHQFRPCKKNAWLQFRVSGSYIISMFQVQYANHGWKVSETTPGRHAQDNRLLRDTSTSHTSEEGHIDHCGQLRQVPTWQHGNSRKHTSRTCRIIPHSKWFATVVSSPQRIWLFPFQMAVSWLRNGGSSLLTNWDGPPSMPSVPSQRNHDQPKGTKKTRKVVKRTNSVVVGVETINSWRKTENPDAGIDPSYSDYILPIH